MGRTTTLVLATLIVSSCGDGGSQLNVQIGTSNELHEGYESILAMRLEQHPDGLSLTEAEALKEVVQPEQAPLGKVNAKAASDTALLANYTLYAKHMISSRIIGKGALQRRDACLERCFNDTRCGAVTYDSLGGFCFYHGPTLSTDMLVPTTVKGKNGDSEFDSYVIVARNQEYIEDGLGDWSISASNGNGTNASPKMRFLYTDGTASAWKTLDGPFGAERYGDLGESETRGVIEVPAKEIEGIILNLTSEDTLGLGRVGAMRIECRFCQNSVPHYPMVAWFLLESNGTGRGTFRLGGGCDDNVLDGCAPTVALRLLEVDYSYFDPYSDGGAMSLQQLQRDTNDLTW